MRIIAGKYKGRPLITPPDDTIRPTSDRTRESLFNLLMHGQFGGTNIIDQPVADLCCGTGALGLEALSRGASSCLFVDNHETSLKLARTNAERFGLLDGTRGGPTGPTMQRSGMRGDESRNEKGRRDAPLGERSEQKVTFLNADVSKLPNAPHPCALILFDAPYNSAFLQKTLESLLQKNWLLPEALICLEQQKSESIIELQGLTLIDTRSYGKASLRIYQFSQEL